jgi:hypothetical protein
MKLLIMQLSPVCFSLCRILSIFNYMKKFSLKLCIRMQIIVSENAVRVQSIDQPVKSL